MIGANLKKTTISLSKGQSISLAKEAPGLNNVVVGLGWDPAKQGLFGFGGGDIDCDAFCLTLDQNNRLIEKIYFGYKHSRDGAINHLGDNLTGAGEGDDEQMTFKLTQISSDVQKIIIAVNIFRGKSRNQHFGKISNAFVRLVDQADDSEVCVYKLSGTQYNGLVTVVFGELYRDVSGQWQFKAVGEGDKAESIDELARRFR